MGATAGPDIIEDGLVLCLDAANRASYPGSGTVWSSLVDGSSGALINGPTFNSANAGSIVFDGVNDYVNLGSQYFISTTQPFTIHLWFKNNWRTTSTEFHALVVLRALGVAPFRIAYVTILNSGYRGLYITSSSGWARAKTSYLIDRNVPGLVTLTYNGNGSTNISNFNMYWNMLKLTFDTTGVATPGATTDNNYLGVRQNADSQIYRGEMSVLHVYNRALTPAEILQNYNVTKGRFLL